MAPKRAEAKCLSLISSSRKPAGTPSAHSELPWPPICSQVFVFLLYERHTILRLRVSLPPPHSRVLEGAGPLLFTVRTNLKVVHKPFTNIQTPRMSRLMGTSENNQGGGARGPRLHVNDGVKKRF